MIEGNLIIQDHDNVFHVASRSQEAIQVLLESKLKQQLAFEWSSVRTHVGGSKLGTRLQAKAFDEWGSQFDRTVGKNQIWEFDHQTNISALKCPQK